MTIETFHIIGENIHCTRSYKIDGRFVDIEGERTASILYKDAGNATCRLPVPASIMAGADWQSGKVRHSAVAVWQGMYGKGESGERGRDYLRSLALRQQRAGAAYLDINIDEFSTGIDERCKAMRWVVELLTPVVTIPLSIDSSNTSVLGCGLEVCDRTHGAPMVNSVSLERLEAVAVAAEHRAVVIASAAGEQDLPADTAGRMANLKVLMKHLKAAGMQDGAIYFDPLVIPVATDSNNGRAFLDAVRAIRDAYGTQVHVVGGFSNVSFGMPCRKLINQVFTRLAVDAGADGGIVDPFHINRHVLNELDPGTESFGLARALLTGEDAFGVEFIAAYRDGRLAV